VNPCSATCHSTVATTIPEREREKERVWLRLLQRWECKEGKLKYSQFIVPNLLIAQCTKQILLLFFNNNYLKKLKGLFRVERFGFNY